MFVGEGGGREEEKRGIPFIGASGELLRNTINCISKNHKFNYIISNVVKGRPKDEDGNNRQPTPVEIRHCSKFLEQEIERYKPKIIVALGATAYRHMVDDPSTVKFNMFMEEGCVRETTINGKQQYIIGSLHPSWILRNYHGGAGLLYNAINKAVLFSVKGIRLDASGPIKSNLVSSLPKVKKILSDMFNTPSPVGVDVECNNLNRVYENKLLSIQLSNNRNTGYLIPFDHFESPFSVEEKKQIGKWLKYFFTSKKTKVPMYLFANPKFEMHQFLREFKFISYNAPLVDVSYNQYLLEENTPRVVKEAGKIYPDNFGPYSLGTLSYRYGFGEYYKSSNPNMNKSIRTSLSTLPITDWLDYGCADAVLLLRVWKNQLIEATEAGWVKNFKKMALYFNSHLSKVLCYIEHCGQSINIDTLRYYSSPRTSPMIHQMDKVLEELCDRTPVKNVMKRVVGAKTGHNGILPFAKLPKFNPNSKIHYFDLFFNEMKLKTLKVDGKGNPKQSCDKDFCAHYENIPEVFLFNQWKEIQKAKSTYIDAIYNKMTVTDPLEGEPDFYTDGRVRASFIGLTTTGRLRSFNPNAQQRIKRGTWAKDVQALFESPTRRYLATMDYKSIEVRGLADRSKDPLMLKQFEDIAKMIEVYKTNPNKFLPKGHKGPVLRLALYNNLKKKKVWKTEDIIKQFPKWVKDIGIDNKVKGEYIQFVSDILRKEDEWSVTGVKDKLDNILKQHILRIISHGNFKVLTDSHIRSASIIFRKKPEDITVEERDRIKGFVFGGMYGQSVGSLARELGIPIEEARKIKKSYEANMPEAVKHLDKMEKLGAKQLYIDSGIGRRRHLWGYLINRDEVLQQMPRLSRNSPIQGMCSDFNIIATSLMIDKIYEMGRGKYQVPDSEAFLITNVVHDSCEFESKIGSFKTDLLTMREVFVNDLRKHLKEVFDYDMITTPAVDFDCGLLLSNMRNWDGSDIHLDYLKKWIKQQDMNRG
jgi:uracil-DNA glycosylase family 4